MKNLKKNTKIKIHEKTLRSHNTSVQYFLD